MPLPMTTSFLGISVSLRKSKIQEAYSSALDRKHKSAA
jgi:hypothetical protein